MVLPQPGPTRLRDYPAFFRFVTRVIDWPVLGFDSPKKAVRRTVLLYRGVQLIRGNLTSKITLNGENHGFFSIVIQAKKDLCLNS